MRRDLVHGPLEDRHRRAQELVDRRPDDDDQLVCPGDHRAVGPELEPAGWQELAQQLVGAGLEERHLAAADPVERPLVGVVDPDPQPRLGEGKAQREADMPAAAEDHDVELLVSHRADSSSGAVERLPLADGPVPAPGGSDHRRERPPVCVRVELCPAGLDEPSGEGMSDATTSVGSHAARTSSQPSPPCVTVR